MQARFAGIWSILGMLDLAMAVTLGVLASPGVRILSDQATTGPMGDFSLSLIPTFFVPLLFIFHLVTLSYLRKRLA